jgi:hypothetical protein
VQVDAPDLVALERRTYLAAYDNGLWDIFLGLWFLVVGIGVIRDAGALPAILLAISIEPWRRLHKRTSESRVGYVRVNRRRARRLHRGPQLLAVFAGLLVILLIWRAELGELGGGISGEIGAFALLGILVAAAGYVFEFTRLYAYAVVIAIGAAADVAFPALTLWILMGIGAVIGAVGAWTFAAYLRRYPALAAEADA